MTSPTDPSQPYAASAGSASPYGAVSANEPGNVVQPYAQAGYDPNAYAQAGYQQPYAQAGYDPNAYAQAGYQQPYAQAYAVPGTQKSKMAAGLLGIFLGSLGIHNFYLGHTGKAVAQLLITLLSLGFLALVSEIWGLVEGVLILTAQPGSQPWGVDAKGIPLQG